MSIRTVVSLVLLCGLVPVAVDAPAGQAAAGRPVPASAPATTAPAGPLRVLFIGSSYTMYNGMIKMVAGLSRKATVDRPVECRQVIIGGSSLQNHWLSKRSMRMLRDGEWDIVVLQGHHYVYRNRQKALLEYGPKFAEEVRKKKARLIWYMTWPNRRDAADPSNLKKVRDVYLALRAKVGGTIAPAGEAIAEALRERPDLGDQLYFKDGYHPGPAGSYAIACSIFAAIYGRSPEGLPGTLYGRDIDERRKKPCCTLDDKTARFLQSLAWKAVGRIAKARPKPGG